MARTWYDVYADDGRRICGGEKVTLDEAKEVAQEAANIARKGVLLDFGWGEQRIAYFGVAPQMKLTFGEREGRPA